MLNMFTNLWYLTFNISLLEKLKKAAHSSNLQYIVDTHGLSSYIQC